MDDPRHNSSPRTTCISSYNPCSLTNVVPDPNPTFTMSMLQNLLHSFHDDACSRMEWVQCLQAHSQAMTASDFAALVVHERVQTTTVPLYLRKLESLGRVFPRHRDSFLKRGPPSAELFGPPSNGITLLEKITILLQQCDETSVVTRGMRTLGEHPQSVQKAFLVRHLELTARDKSCLEKPEEDSASLQTAMSVMCARLNSPSVSLDDFVDDSVQSHFFQVCCDLHGWRALLSDSVSATSKLNNETRVKLCFLATLCSDQVTKVLERCDALLLLWRDPALSTLTIRLDMERLQVLIDLQMDVGVLLRIHTASNSYSQLCAKLWPNTDVTGPAVRELICARIQELRGAVSVVTNVPTRKSERVRKEIYSREILQDLTKKEDQDVLEGREESEAEVVDSDEEDGNDETKLKSPTPKTDKAEADTSPSGDDETEWDATSTVHDHSDLLGPVETLWTSISLPILVGKRGRSTVKEVEEDKMQLDEDEDDDINSDKEEESSDSEDEYVPSSESEGPDSGSSDECTDNDHDDDDDDDDDSCSSAQVLEDASPKKNRKRSRRDSQSRPSKRSRKEADSSEFRDAQFAVWTSTYCRRVSEDTLTKAIDVRMHYERFIRDHHPIKSKPIRVQDFPAAMLKAGWSQKSKKKRKFYVALALVAFPIAS